MGLQTPVSRLRRIAIGAIAGVLLFVVLFAIELGRTNIQFMGTSDADAVKTIVGTYQGRIVGQQLLLLALALVVGGLSGAIGGWYSTLTNRQQTRRGAFAFGVAAAIFVHAYFGLRSLSHYPALYVESLFEGGGAARWLMIAMTKVWTPLRVDLVFGALVLLAVVVVTEEKQLKRWAPRVVVVGIAALAIGWGWRRAPRFAKTDKPHVFLIAVDSLRADRVFSERTAKDFPAMAALAKKAVRLREDFVTVPRTFSSFVTLLSGRFPQHHGIRHMFPRPEARAAVGPTLATALRQAGYRTLAVSDYAGEIFTRTALGFQTIDAPYFDIRTIVDQRSLAGHPNLLPYATSALLEPLFPSVNALPERSDPSLLVQKALRQLDRQPRDQPLFLTLFFSTAHFPYAAPAPFYRRFADPAYDGPFRFSKLPLVETKDDADIRQIRALYDGAVAATDDALGTFVKELDQRGLLANSVIVLLADHGEELYDVKQNGMGHGDHLEGAHANHVPLLILDGRGKLAPRDVDAMVRDVDVAPTLAALLGLPPLPADGVDLGPLLRGEKPDLGLFSYSETELWLTASGPGFPAENRLPYPGVTGVTELLPDGDIVLQTKWEPLVIAGKHRVLRTPEWKLVYRPTATGAKWSLYDRKADPEEQRDVKAERPLLFPLLQKQLAAWIALDGSEERGGYYLPIERAVTAATPATSSALTVPSAPPSNVAPPIPSVCSRLIDCAGSATYEGPALGAALAAAKYPRHFVSRWSGLPDGKAERVASVSLTVPNVARYPEARVPGATRLDPVWNRTRGVYESKAALVAPAGSVYRFPLTTTGPSTLRSAIATLPTDPAVEMSVEVDGAVVQTMIVGPRGYAAGLWNPIELALPAGKELALRVTARSKSWRSPLALWGLPTITPRIEGTANTRTATATNVVIVLIDTLRADAFSVMPNLQALAGRGARFTQAVSCATWTRPALLGLYGGELPSRLGHSAEEMIPSVEARDRFYEVAPVLLPRTLAARDYNVTAIGNNFFLLGYPQIGLDLGFDQVTDIRHPQLDTPAITRAVEQFIAVQQNRPFLLHVHYDAPHWPYTPPPEMMRGLEVPAGFPADVDSAKYLAEARFADQHLGILLGALKTAGIEDKTIVVVLGDHGEVFDHAHDHIVKALDLPTLHHHGWSAYDEVARVPLVIAGPGIAAGKTIDAPVSIIDVAPTLTELLGLPPLGGGESKRSGQSLLPRIAGTAPTGATRDLFVEGQNIRLLRDGRYAYLRRGDGRLQKGKTIVDVKEELYDLVADPAQHDNAIDRLPAVRDDLRRRFERVAPNLHQPDSDVVHLRLDGDDRDVVVEGIIESDRPLQLAGASAVSAAPLGDRKVQITLRAPASIDLVLGGGAELKMTLRKNGTPIEGDALRLGRFALPLLHGAIRLGTTEQSWLDSPVPPPTASGQIVVWRERASHGRGTRVTSDKTDGDVATMMKRWGYAK